MWGNVGFECEEDGGAEARSYHTPRLDANELWFFVSALSDVTNTYDCEIR
jgi:hypothetical protein